MQRSSWYALLFVAIIGSAIGGAIALALVALVGWLGILIVGLSILFIAMRAELDADSPAMSVTRLRRQYEQTFEGTAEGRRAKFADRIEQNRWLYIARTGWTSWPMPAGEGSRGGGDSKRIGRQGCWVRPGGLMACATSSASRR
jgi:Zn-dependent protease with chaperone function